MPVICRAPLRSDPPKREEDEPEKATKAEIAEAERAEAEEQRRQNAERMAEKWDRRAKYSLDPDNRRMAEARAREWASVAEGKPYADRAEEILQAARSKYGEGFMASAETSGGHLVRYEDITDRWYPDAKPGSHKVEDLMEYTAPDGKVYRVHGRDVVLDYRPREKEIAELLEREVGGEIFMVPRVNNPQGVRTPDYIFHGKPYDLKTLKPNSTGKTMFSRAKKSAGQTGRIIFDVTAPAIPDSEVDEQIGRIFWSKDTQFVDEVVVIRDEKIIRVVRRK